MIFRVWVGRLLRRWADRIDWGLDRVTRVELITDAGRQFVDYDVRPKLSALLRHRRVDVP